MLIQNFAKENFVSLKLNEEESYGLLMITIVVSPQRPLRIKNANCQGPNFLVQVYIRAYQAAPRNPLKNPNPIKIPPQINKVGLFNIITE